MSIEGTLIAQAQPYMAAARAKALIREEISIAFFTKASTISFIATVCTISFVKHTHLSSLLH